MPNYRIVDQEALGMVLPLVAFLNENMDIVSATRTGLSICGGEPGRVAPCADAAINCFALVSNQIEAMTERQSFDGVHVLLELAQDTCRRATWFFSLLVELGDSMHFKSLRWRFQHALDKSHAEWSQNAL